jgi:ribitol 2-dehydrogenase
MVRFIAGNGTDVLAMFPLDACSNTAWDCYNVARVVLSSRRRRPMTRELEGKIAAVTGAASGIGLASTEAMLAAGARVVMVDRDAAALQALRGKHGDAVIPLLIDLLDAKDCATLLPKILEQAGQLDIFHANAGSYVGGDLVDAETAAIDRMLNLNVNVVMKNVHDVLPHMIARGTGDIIITSSLAAHFPTPWEPVYASSKWAINCFVQTVRRQVFKHGIRVGSISPGPVVTALLADWPPEKLQEARDSGSLLEASEVADVVIFMLTRPRGMTIRDVVMLPTNFDL